MGDEREVKEEWNVKQGRAGFWLYNRESGKKLAVKVRLFKYLKRVPNINYSMSISGSD